MAMAEAMADAMAEAARRMARGSTRRRAVRLLVVLLLLLLPAPPVAQEAGSRLDSAGAGYPDSCPAAKPGIWALVLILGIVAALSLGFILHSELTLRRARKTAQARARERSRAAAWGYPPSAPPMPRGRGEI